MVYGRIGVGLRCCCTVPVHWQFPVLGAAKQTAIRQSRQFQAPLMQGFMGRQSHLTRRDQVVL